MIELRPYQKESIELLRQSFSHGNKCVILCLPTGAGKTVVFSEMVRLAHSKKTKTLVLTDRIELFKQTYKALSRHGIEIQEIKAGKKSFDYSAITTVAMIETIKRRDTDFYHPDLIIIDEAHKGNFTKIFDKFPNARVIGATATPVGKHIPKYYHDIVANIDIPDLVANRFLMPCKAYQMQDDFSDLEVKRGEYTENSLWNHFNDRKLFTGLIEKWKEKAINRKTLVFNVNIDHAEQMTKEFNQAGILSECITSKTPKLERERILKAFTDGFIPVLNNCGILTTGYDEPSIECIVMNRKTKSLPLWLQCCGRGSRLHPGKSDFMVLDFGMNHDEHGLWEEPRIWTIEQKKKKKKDQAAPVKECPNCEAMVYASARNCPHCNHEFKQKEEELAEGVLVEVKPKAPSKLQGRMLSSLNLDELIELQKSKRYKTAYVWRIVRSKGVQAIKEYGQKMGYSSGWMYRQKQMLNDINFYDNEIRG
jgi:superfamily II DNA or RNA helicase